MNITPQIHDFASKLNQKEARPHLVRYLQSFQERVAHSRKFSDLFAQSAGEISVPLSINLDLTVACNYRCPHCIDETILNTKHKFQEETIIKSLINLRLAGLKTIILIGGGEPTIYSKFTEVVNTIKRLGINCGIVSNGSRNDKILGIAHLLTSQDWVRLSLDAGSENTFKRLHAPVREITLKSICETAEAIKERNPKVQIGFSFIVITPEAVALEPRLVENHLEISKATQLARNHKFDYISFKPYLHRDNEGKETIPYSSSVRTSNTLKAIRAQLTEAIKLTNTDFRVVESINLEEIASSEKGVNSTMQPHNCHMQMFRQVLTPTGIYACPAYRGQAKSKIAENDGYSTIEGLVETSNSALNQIKRFNAAHECRNISCIYNSTNWWLQSLVENPAKIEVTSTLSEQAIFL